ncbi:mitochondrial import inner membrane translocase subunit Tim29 [Euwallacea fornicatus]|uniref:mitochondrial import inner membrane translocase subunit Tim29 n=1 Tax=Euwallacea fornicatus TaxID=995702 RepID=UPI00338F18DA
MFERFITRSSTRPFTENSLKHLKSTTDRFNKKIKGTVVEKWINYWKIITKDYKDVAKSVKEDIVQAPFQSSLYFTGATFIALSFKLNPDLKSFRAKYIESANNISLVPLNMANPQSVKHLKYIKSSFNRKLIRHMNLGVMSIVWVDKYSEECDLYENNCPYLQIPYWKFSGQILDVGFLNVWWIISRKMLDFDINY